MTRLRTALIVAFDEFQVLDLAGPIEVLATATRLSGQAIDSMDGGTAVGGAAGYRVMVATPHGRRVRSTSGVDVGADLDLFDPAALGRTIPDLGTLIVVGGWGTRAACADAQVLDAVRGLAGRADRITSVCTGALVLAAAGLLDGYRATTHWEFCDLLARHGAVDVQPDQIYVEDRDRWTSAGVTAGIDLALALVDRDLGPELAHRVATQLVVFARRPGGQAQFSAQLRAQAARQPAIASVQRWLPDHLAEDLTVERLAERAAMSPRSFARAFKAETGTTPAVHVEELRVEAARRLLETTDHTVAVIARSVGLRHGETLHRAFARRVGTTPARYRQHFTRRPA